MYFCENLVMQTLDTYREAFLSFMKDQTLPNAPKNLYEPIAYILDLGGKRMRPVLTLMACDAFSKGYKPALPAALAVEVFHNFSLVHDDIMDDAPLRRGATTVHEKWNINTGILSGDAMLIYSYQLLADYEGDMLQPLLQLYNRTAMEVCEGQQYDVDFETRDDVTIPEYLRMIEYKTSVLVAAALKMGAIVAGADEKNQDLLYEFGRNLGIAFQLQDDYLDAFGNPETFGKQVGGDIIENKKTFLYLKALELSQEENGERLREVFGNQPKDPSEKVSIVKEIFKASGAVDAILKEVEKYTDLAFTSLSQMNISQGNKHIFRQFGEQLMKRQS